MEGKLTRMLAPVCQTSHTEFDVIPGADHLFDREPEFSMDKMYNFIKKSLKME